MVKKTIKKRSDRHFLTCARERKQRRQTCRASQPQSTQILPYPEGERSKPYTINEKVAAEEEETLGSEEVRMMRRSSGGCGCGCRGAHRGRRR